MLDREIESYIDTFEGCNFTLSAVSTERALLEVKGCWGWIWGCGGWGCGGGEVGAWADVHGKGGAISLHTLYATQLHQFVNH